MNPVLLAALLNAAVPGAINLVRDIIALFQKYPGVTPEQFVAIVKQVVTQAEGSYDSTIAQILADQAAHPVPVPSPVPSPPSAPVPIVISKPPVQPGA